MYYLRWLEMLVIPVISGTSPRRAASEQFSCQATLLCYYSEKK